MSTAPVITLPKDISSRQVAKRLVPVSIQHTDAVINAGEVARHGSAGVDELIKRLLATGVQRVIIVNASSNLERAVQVIHRVRTRPERTFLLLFKQVPADALLRSA